MSPPPVNGSWLFFSYFIFSQLHIHSQNEWCHFWCHKCNCSGREWIPPCLPSSALCGPPWSVCEGRGRGPDPTDRYAPPPPLIVPDTGQLRWGPASFRFSSQIVPFVCIVVSLASSKIQVILRKLTYTVLSLTVIYGQYPIE